MADCDPSQRFTNRVDDYVRHRPSYPPQAIDAVIELCQLGRGDHVADVGSGTGIFTALLLERGLEVTAIEPNDAMRAAAERLLAGRPGITSSAGNAEATGLPDQSVKAVTAAQAFHWFDPLPARREFERILQPGGSVALLWNDRRTESTPFLRDYERLLHTHGIDYDKVDHKHISRDRIAAFFSPGTFAARSYENRQTFDFEGLAGRAASTSYVPARGQQGYEPMMAALRQIFDAHQRAGQVVFEYDTLVFCGQLTP